MSFNPVWVLVTPPISVSTLYWTVPSSRDKDPAALGSNSESPVTNSKAWVKAGENYRVRCVAKWVYREEQPYHNEQWLNRLFFNCGTNCDSLCCSQHLLLDGLPWYYSQPWSPEDETKRLTCEQNSSTMIGRTIDGNLLWTCMPLFKFSWHYHQHPLYVLMLICKC